MRSVLFTMILFIFFNLQAQDTQLIPGQKAPVIAVDQWIDAPGFNSEALDDRVVVLDFWFTQCAPCAYTIPHLNDLRKKYSSENVEFLAVTFNKPDIVKEYLKRKILLSKVGIDTTRQLIKAFGVYQYPTTFLIDAKGILRWTGPPDQLKGEMIDILLKKNTYPEIVIPSGSEPTSPTRSSTDVQVKEAYPIEVTRNDYLAGSSSGWQYDQSEISIVNKTLTKIIASMYNTSENHIVMSDSARYDIRFKIPEGLANDQVKPAFIKSLLKEINYKIIESQEKVNGYILLIKDSTLFIENAIDTTRVYPGLSTTIINNTWKAKGAQLSDLIIQMENQFNIFISDQTRLPGFFELAVPMNSFKQAEEELLNEYGLLLIPKEINITRFSLFR